MDIEPTAMDVDIDVHQYPYMCENIITSLRAMTIVGPFDDDSLQAMDVD